ncbi:hypothetical protein ACX0G9_25540 [Flavitalea flava]
MRRPYSAQRNKGFGYRALKEISEEADYVLFAHLTRISDRKRFELPLGDFNAVDQKSVEYQLLEDYSVWIVNY